MPDPITFDTIKDDLLRLWNGAKIIDSRQADADGVAKRLLMNKARYQTVAAEFGAPWWMVAIIHDLEGGGNFSKHLHNGDPLSLATTHVPAGRPVGWNALATADRTWERSAFDALSMKGWQTVKAWPVERCLYELERYNGFGYRQYHPTVKSPYLWSFTTAYTAGKYVSDGKFDLSAVSKQVGAAATMKALAAMNLLDGLQAPKDAPPEVKPDQSVTLARQTFYLCEMDPNGRFIFTPVNPS